jgi:glycolate oxidase FAD binding subunit
MLSPASTSLQHLSAIAGADNARAGDSRDVVDGVIPDVVASPGSIQEVVEILSLAQREGWAVAPRGSGSKMGLGNPPNQLDLILESTRLNRVLEHAPGDLVVKVEAGLELKELQELLARSGQMLALDPPETTATIGGIISTNASGPRRLKYGTVRDLLLGISFVLPGGSIAKAGGKVVKNVAGYDLGKLFTGSLGTLGFITEATFRLHPLPSCSATLLIEPGTPESAGEAVQSLLNSALTPSSIDVARTPERIAIAVLFEGDEASVTAQTETASRQQTEGRRRRLANGAEAAGFWTGQRRQWEADEIGLQITFPISALTEVLEAIEALERRYGVVTNVRGRAGSGILRLGITIDDNATAIAIIDGITAMATELRGAAVVVQAPLGVKREIDVWGPKPDAWPLMERVKAQFDPQNVMNPGRFIGGL